MSYIPISETNVTQTTTNVTQRGFGTILILTPHNRYLERVREYSSVTEVAADFPTTHSAYKAAEAAFSVDPKPRAIKIGRMRAENTLSPVTPVQNMVFSATFILSSTVSVTVSVTAGASPTKTTVATAFAAAINANTTLNPHITAMASGENVAVTALVGHTYALNTVSNLVNTEQRFFESFETTLAAIQSETTDFYCIACTESSDSDILFAAAAVSATKNVFTYATSNQDVLTSFSSASTDTAALLKLGGYKRVVFPVYVQPDQMDLYPHIRIFASKAGYQPGDVIYSNITNLGISPAKTSSGLLLTNGQKSNLADRGLSYFENVNGVTVLRRGQAQGTGSTSWADETIGADFIEARINEQVQSLFSNQYSEKIGGSSAGYARIQSVIYTVLDSMTSTSSTPRLLRKSKVIIPTDSEITAAIRAGRVATIKVQAYLEGALDSAVINVTLTY